jgi:subtilisin-like proprotein convertase family protein
MSPAALAQTDNPEVEPNQSKATATLAASGGAGMVSGDFLSGTSTSSSTSGTSPANIDYFRVRLAPAALGIYEHRLQITTTGTAGHTGIIRGRSQSTGVINSTSDIAFQTSSTSSVILPARTNVVYGFGKGEDFFYSISGAAATSVPYKVTLTTTPVTPTVVAGTILPGSITIQNGASNANDMDFWVFDSNLTAIPTYGNDGPNLLTRTYAPGDYYIAWSNYNFATNQPAPTDDTFRSENVVDTAIAVCSSTTSFAAGGAFDMRIVHTGGTIVVPSQKDYAFQIRWIKFTVATPANPTGTGSASPVAGAAAGETITLTVNTNQGNPPAAITSVVADLTAFPPLTSTSLVEGPANVWTGSFVVPAGTSQGAKTIPFTITDASARTGTGNISTNVLPPVFNDLKISRVYGGGGLNTTTPNADYVEIYNAGPAARDLTGYAVQIAGSTSTSWTVINLSGSIASKSYALIRCETTSTTGTALPTPDFTNATSPMLSTGGKAAITAKQSALSTSNPLPDARVVDFVGYGTGTPGEGGSPAVPTITSLFCAQRACRGGTDTDSNANDFVLIDPNGAFNSSSPTNSGLSLVINALPSSVAQDADLVFSVKPSDCSNPGSPVLGATVTANMSNLGGGPGFVMNDAGTNGDTAAGDGIYTATYRVPFATTTGSKAINFSATVGANNLSTSGSTTVTAATTGACCVGATCSITTARLCADGGGTYKGNGTNCAGTPNKFFDTESVVPVAIPDGNTTGITLTVTVPPSETATIDQLQVALNLVHSWIGDLQATISNGTTTVTLFQRIGRDGTISTLGDSSNFDGIYTFADSGADIWTAVTAGDSTYNLPSGTYRPSAATNGALPSPSLAAFDGAPFAGTWTLTIADAESIDTGSVRGFRIQTTGTRPTCGCPGDYNLDTFINLDDLGDFITDYYYPTPIPGGAQPDAPTYPGLAVGFGQACPAAPDAPLPYAVDAYRTNGYRVGYSADGSNSCPLSPDAPFPNLDNLGDYITFFYTLNQGPCS